MKNMKDILSVIGFRSSVLTADSRKPIAMLAFSCLFSTMLAMPSPVSAQTKMTPAKIDALKTELTKEIDKQQKFTQEMVDMVFSFGELGFQEVETSKYLTDILQKMVLR